MDVDERRGGPRVVREVEGRAGVRERREPEMSSETGLGAARGGCESEDLVSSNSRKKVAPREDILAARIGVLHAGPRWKERGGKGRGPGGPWADDQRERWSAPHHREWRGTGGGRAKPWA